MGESVHQMGSSGNKRCGILSGIFGSLVTLGIGIVIGLYAIDDCDTCPSLGFVPESDRVPIQLRRTTFVVYNMTRSRAFYEDGLGMVPIYDKIIKTPNDAETSSEPVGDYLDRVLKVENTMMQEEPMVTQYPAYEGDGMITVNRTTVIDPDGNIVEINQILDGLDLDTEGF